MHFMVEKRSGFEIYPYFKDSAFTAVRIKGCKVLNQVYGRGNIRQWDVHGVSFCQKWYI